MPDLNQSKPVVQPRDTYRQFLASASSQLYHFITTPLQIPVDDLVQPSASENSPSTPILPGSYPVDRSSPVSPAISVYLEEPGLAPPSISISESNQASTSASHVIETLGRYDQSEGPEGPVIPPSSLHVSERVVASTPHGKKELGQSVFRDCPEGPIPSKNSSRNSRSHTPVPESTAAAQFQGAYGFSISGNPNFTNIGYNVNHYGGSHGLEHMERFVSFNAFFNSAVQDPDRKCHPGTRIVVLNQIRNWFDNTTSAERACWLHGPAGAGKSAIAQTIAHSCSQEQIIATFFFYRSDASRNDGNCLFTTIAWQLAFSIPGIKDYIARALERRPDLPRMSIETQFEELVVQPFRSLKDVLAHLPLPIVIIDGVDECIDEKLQRRFLKLIGNSIKDNLVPLRFLICSRPEAHIQETIDQFPKPNLRIDLASLDDANHDIERYLKDEFSRIASDQGLDAATWPGHAKIQQILYKALGQFVYASTVIRYVSDEYNSAVTQLDIILGLKPLSSSKPPFAELDALFIEILERQPDRDFLMTFLTLLTARLSVTPRDGQIGRDDFHLDDSMLMNVSAFELHRKLRGMRSLFKFEPYIDLHHRSFLDFLQDPSRSGQFFIEHPQRRYLELIVDSVVRFVSKTIDQPHYHAAGHFCPQFSRIAHVHPRRLKLPVTEWHRTIKPLLCLQDRLLCLPNFISTWNLLPCNTCTAFQIMRDLLLHLVIMEGTCHPETPSIQTMELCLDGSVVIKSTDKLVEAGTNDQKDQLVACLYSLLNQFREAKSVNTATLRLMCSLLHFDSSEIANRVYSVADAQILMDSIDSLTNSDYFLNQCGPNTAQKVVHLALEIFARVPVLPRALFMKNNTCSDRHRYYVAFKNFEMFCQTALLRRVSDHNYVVPLLQIIEEEGEVLWFVIGITDEIKSLGNWRDAQKPSSVEKMRAMLEVAKAIRYLHSIDVVFDQYTELGDIFLDSQLQAKVRCLCSTSRYLIETPKNYLWSTFEKKWLSYKANVFIFGCFFYEVYFDCTVSSKYMCESPEVSKRPSDPLICEDAWQLIQRCCADDPEARPSMDQVVQEMESWNLSSTV